MSTVDVEPDGRPEAPEGEPVSGWLEDRAGRAYIRSPSGRGNLYRIGEETVEDALSRHARPPDQRPRHKTKRPKKPPPPKADLRELEQMLAEAFKAPAVPCAAFGDEWAANHFTQNGPLLARNLVLSAQHNPWLRKKLEQAASGGDMMMLVFSMIGLTGGVIMYTLPPLIWWFNVPVPDGAREMFDVPERRDASRPPQTSPVTAAAQAA